MIPAASAKPHHCLVIYHRSLRRRRRHRRRLGLSEPSAQRQAQEQSAERVALIASLGAAVVVVWPLFRSRLKSSVVRFLQGRARNICQLEQGLVKIVRWCLF